MPTTRKKIIKTVYKDEDESEVEGPGDFSDSGSDAVISQPSSSEEDEEEPSDHSSGDDTNTTKKKLSKTPRSKKTKFAKTFVRKINKQEADTKENTDMSIACFTVKDLTEADKLLPSIFLNLSESDSSEDESPKPKFRQDPSIMASCSGANDAIDDEPFTQTEYKDVWSANIKDQSDEIALKTFLELEQHKTKIEKTKMTILNYTSNQDCKNVGDSDVKDLLALGEEVIPEATSPKPKRKLKKKKIDSDSDMEDWEEVKESKAIPQQGLQLVVDIPDSVCRKVKKVDVEMMMKRKINRVKKEYQVYMHKVHVLCWLGHGNYLSTILNDQEIMSAALSLVPSKECYPGNRVDLKYVEQITCWYKDKITLKQDKNEEKFRPKALPLKCILLEQIKKRVMSTKKYIVLVFVAMLRAIGLQCRVILNFNVVPIKPPSSELCSLSTKIKNEKSENQAKTKEKVIKKKSNKDAKHKIPQLDGMVDMNEDSDNNYCFDNIMQVDGNDDSLGVKTRNSKARVVNKSENNTKEDNVSPPKKFKKNHSPVSKTAKHTENETFKDTTTKSVNSSRKSLSLIRSPVPVEANKVSPHKDNPSPRKTRSGNKINVDTSTVVSVSNTKNLNTSSSKCLPKTNAANVSSKYFKNTLEVPNSTESRKRSLTAVVAESENKIDPVNEQKTTRNRTKSAPVTDSNKSKYFDVKSDKENPKERKIKRPRVRMQNNGKTKDDEDNLRISHKDLKKPIVKAKNDVTEDLVHIIRERVRETKETTKRKCTKVKKEESDDSDYLPEEEPSKSQNDDDQVKSSKSRSSRQIDRRVLSPDTETSRNKIDVWCEIYVEELEQWVPVDVIKGKVHCAKELYTGATHPVTYIVGWENNNYLKDLTRRYVPQWNTVTRKQRTERQWWEKAIKPWLGPKTARDKEEDENLDRMQLEAPLPKSIAEYKNHPLYALKRHLLKFEAIYPSDAATLGFVRGEPVYARECVYTCRSRDTWLKEAKVVRLGEQPYKIVKARPKWDKLSNKVITDKALEIFGPWQVQDYEPPTAENGIVPRNAYGNVELFKSCMLPKGTVHIKLPGLNRVAKKLNIDCAPAMTGFDFNGGWTHPVFDGFVVCNEYEEILTEAWLKDQEEQERKEQEKIEARVYGNWKRLIRGLFIRERLKLKYGFDDPSTTEDKKKSKGPRFVVKK